MCDWVPLVQFRKREKHRWRRVFPFFKFYMWYQIAKSITMKGVKTKSKTWKLQ